MITWRKPKKKKHHRFGKTFVRLFTWCTDSNLFWIMLAMYLLTVAASYCSMSQSWCLSFWCMVQFCSAGRSSRRPNYQLKVPADLLHRDRRPLRFGLNHLCQVVIPVPFEGCMLSLLVSYKRLPLSSLVQKISKIKKSPVFKAECNRTLFASKKERDQTQAKSMKNQTDPNILF